MNQVAQELFPGAVSNSSMRFDIHKLAELYIEEKRMLREPMKIFSLYRQRLKLLKARANSLELCRVTNGQQRSDREEHEMSYGYTRLFNGKLNPYEGIIKRGKSIPNV